MFLKKITILSTLFFFIGASNVFADDANPLTPNFKDPNTSYQPENKDLTPNFKDSNTSYGAGVGVSNSTKSSSAPQFSCEGGKDALCSEQFKIDTGKFSPGGKGLNKTSSKATINGFMTTLIKKLMVALGSLALIVMVVGAGFMMFAMGKDDNLNKGKTIFKAGIIALVIALSSYFMVSFLSYILYS